MTVKEWKTTRPNFDICSEWFGAKGDYRISHLNPAPQVTFSAYRDSISTANFRKLHDLPINPFYFYANRYSGVAGWADRYVSNPDGRYHLTGSNLEPYVGAYTTTAVGLIGSSYAAIPTSVKDAAIAKCANKLLLQIKDQKVNLAQVYAERAQTADLFASTAKRVVGTVVALKHGQIATAARHLGIILPRRKKARMRRRWLREQSSSIGSNLLELRYGWEPLLSDIYGACEVLAARDVTKVEYPSVTAVQTLKQSDDVTKHSGNVTYPGNVRRKTEVFWQVRYGVRYVVTSPGLQTLASLGITNPAVIAWELTPWSFVIDWFLPIGNWLSTWDATLGLSFKDGYQTVFQRVKVEFTKVGFNSNRKNAGTDCFLTSQREEVFCQRKKLTSFPSPTLPQLKNPFSTQHVQNALALLSNLLRK